MALKVIGSGLGRTGTTSLQTALEILGFGPCHHMMEVLTHPETMPLWIEAGNGRPQWNTIFAGYRSAVDYPSATYWRELAAHYPDAKIVHTIRDPDAWFESAQATIFASDGHMTQNTGPEGEIAAAFFKSFTKRFYDHLNDRAFLIDYFCRHTEEVEAAIPPERLLVYEVGQGWDPLCAFLAVPVPDTPYPSQNSRSEFIDRHLSDTGGTE